ncbi:MAG: hypothetical protein ACRC7S_18780 [Cetobacterium sp.]
MKVKLIANMYFDNLQNEINDFIKDKEIIDIKFSVTTTNLKSVLIMYK